MEMNVGEIKLKIKIGFEILSNFNPVMTVAFFVNDSLSFIVAGESYRMLHKLDEM
jgi:hypothetical protein